MTDRERIEGGRRARAAMAYAGLHANDLLPLMHMSPATFGRVLNGTRKETTREDLWKIIEACKLPRDLLAADLSRVSEIVAPGQPAFGDSTILREQMEQELDGLVRRAAKPARVAAVAKRGRPRGGR